VGARDGAAVGDNVVCVGSAVGSVVGDEVVASFFIVFASAHSSSPDKQSVASWQGLPAPSC